MISCDKGEVVFNGSKILLQAELATLIHVMLQNGIMSVNKLYSLCKDATMSEEKLRVDLVDKIRKSLFGGLEK